MFKLSVDLSFPGVIIYVGLAVLLVGAVLGRSSPAHRKLAYYLVYGGALIMLSYFGVIALAFLG